MKVEDVQASIEVIKEMVEKGDLEAANSEQVRLLWEVITETSKGRKNSQSLALGVLKLKDVAIDDWYG